MPHLFSVRYFRIPPNSKNSFENKPCYTSQKTMLEAIYTGITSDDGIIFSIADCTGHGVAGAFMSIMAISILKDAVTTFKA